MEEKLLEVKNNTAKELIWFLTLQFIQVVEETQ